VTYLPSPVKGNADYRNYKAIRLQNGITALLAQDAQSKHFAAAVSVNAGASSDPRSLPGLAHFTEHMCFLGSKRYPEENEYKHYLAQHGGKSNASTSMSHTTYQFDILAEYGEQALDIFSNFFVSPLFTRSGTAREVQAVDSENSKNLVSDGRRRLQVLKALADKDHHYSKFSTGNRITLPACADAEEGGDEKKDDDNDTKESGSDDSHPLKDMVCSNGKCDDADLAEFVRIALLAFHRQHYRPHNMTVVVVGPQTLDELEKMVVPRFGVIADHLSKNYDDDQADNDDHNITPEKKDKWQRMQQLAAQLIAEAATDAPPVPIEAAKNVAHRSAFSAELHGGKWPVVITTKPLQNVRKVVLMFPIPPSYSDPDRSPSHLMSHLFGHEGKGSAFAFYQNAGWITSLTSGSRISAPDQNLFQISITLTKEGEEHWRDVVKYIFAYAKMLCAAAEETLKLSNGGGNDACKSDGRDDLYRIWDEVGRLDRMQFHQTSPGHVYSFAQSVSQSISKYGTTNCLSAGSLLNETRDSLPLSELLDFCQQIVPSNCFIERCSEGAWDEMEALYGDGEPDTADGFAFGKQKEQWYGVEYFVSPTNGNDVKLWEEGIGAKEAESIHLPEPNRYIPRSLELCDELPEEARVQRIELPVSPPNLIVNTPAGRLWWKLDERYALPKAYLTVLIRTRASENKLQSYESDQSSTIWRWEYDSKSSMQSEFLKSIFTDALAIDTYDAYLAGLGWSLSKTSSGFTLTCHGYSDRLPDLALKLLNELTSPSFLAERHFTTAKDKIVRGLSSFFESRRADSLAIYYRNLLLNFKGCGVEQNLEIARAITLKDIEKHHALIWADDDLSLEVLYTGNVSEKQARTFFSDATDIIATTRPLVTQKEGVENSSSGSWVSGKC